MLLYASHESHQHGRGSGTCLSDNNLALALVDRVCRDFEIEWRRTLANATRDVVVGAVARAEPGERRVPMSVDAVRI